MSVLILSFIEIAMEYGAANNSTIELVLSTF